MAFVNKIDTDGNKTTLLKGELALDLVTGTDDYGTVYIGDGTTNIAINPKAPMPTLNIPSSVNGGSSTSISYTIDEGATIAVTVTTGTITNLGNSTFTYNAPDVIASGTIATFTAYGASDGTVRSNSVNVSTEIVYVPITPDTTTIIQVVDIFNDLETNNGFEEIV